MKKVKTKFCITSLISLMLMLVSSMVLLTVSVFDQLHAVFNIDETTYYTYTNPDDNLKYRCFILEDTQHLGAKKVAIAWFYGDEESPQVVPATINVPEEVTLSGEDYTVAAILRGGFRDLSFTTINLPKTIEEIGEEAFGYCTSMTSFTIPYKIKKIAPSTFIDCKNLEVFYYTGLTDEEDEESAIEKKYGNNTITEIGDHAFDNCVKLKGLYLPDSIEIIGNSAFQRCELLQSLFFPGAPESITVGSYAFADCPILKTVYFEENLTYVDNYAFADCKEDLTFTYTGSSAPTTFAEHWRDKNTTTENDHVYEFTEFDASPVELDTTYPGIIYSIETITQYLDSAGGQTPAPVIIQGDPNEPYVKIHKFLEPFESKLGYYNYSTKSITIPDEIEGYPVKVIGATAFAGSPIKKVTFNTNLVQIQTRAFWGCSTIDFLDFSACDNLREISYEIFQSPCPQLQSTDTPDVFEGSQVYNTDLHSLSLPASLEYIGDSAFYNFIGLTEGIRFTCNSEHPSLKVIGDFAFAVHRSKTTNQNKTTGLMDLVLPNTLDDRYVTGGVINGETIVASNYWHPYTPSWKPNDTLRQDRYAVGRFAFENQDLIGTVTMEKADPAQEEDMNHTTSFLSNAFCRCDNLRKFQSNKNLYMIGTDSFKLCKNLKELFLYSEKAQWQYNHGGAIFPWGITDNGGLRSKSSYDLGIFSSGSGGSGTNSHQDAVIYVSGEKAPGLLDEETEYKDNTYMWNRDQTNTLLTGLQSGGAQGQISNRKQIPTFYECVWEGAADDINILYWKPNNTYKSLTSAQYTLTTAEYNEGYIAIAPAKEDGKYAIARYFSDGATGNFQDEIDLTNICAIGNIHTAISSNLVEIAPSAFATDTKNKVLGKFFILPSTVLRIGERAFFRRSGGNAIGIVTYKDSTIKVPTSEADPTTHDYTYYKSNYNSSVGGYCILPPTITRIEANSFFNHNFKTIEISKNVTYLGASAFVVSDYDNRATDVVMESNADPLFESANDGLYYTKVADKKMLVYQAAGTSSDTLTIDSGTKAIGFRAAIKTNYQTITIPAGLKIIYGSAFHNAQMEEINGDLSSLQYINNRTLSGDTEVYDSGDYGVLPFDNYDVTPIVKWPANSDTYINGGRAGAFRGCSKLKTIDFSDMSSLRVIGQDAFNGCSSLATGSSKTYTIYNYVGKSSSQAAEVKTYSPSSDGGSTILDLSNSTNLNSIKSDAFKSAELIKYTILPSTTNKAINVASTLTLANNTNVLPPKSQHLIGDTYHQAGLLYKNSTLKPRDHYPKNAIGRGGEGEAAEGYNFYRFWVSDLPAGLTIEDYLAHSYDGNLYNIIQYWTIYNGDYYLFKGYNQAKKFYELVNANPVTYTAGTALNY